MLKLNEEIYGKKLKRMLKLCENKYGKKFKTKR